MFDLTKLLIYDHVVIQCHDDPDPDAIATAFALYKFLTIHKKNVQIVYSGISEIRKTNLLLMIVELNIPLKFIKRDEDPAIFEGRGKNILVTVDCQYGAGNVKKLVTNEFATIDHHVKERPEPPLSDIRPFLGSCSTLVWHLLCHAGFDFKNHLDVGTALYYGLYTDTSSLSEIMHPLDMDLRDSIKYDPGLIRKLKNSNLSIRDLTVAANTLNNRIVCEKISCAVFEAEACDPNILGFTSDLALQVDNIDVCVLFCRVNGGLKLSVRSCVREVMANELVKKICEEIGSGGGRNDKAGGFISIDRLGGYNITNPSGFLLERLTQYFGEYDHVYCGRLDLHINKLDMYRKKAIPIGFVRSVDVFPEGREFVVRTLEGDTHVTADKDTYIMVGIDQGVWPIKRAKFEASYHEMDSLYIAEENPTYKNQYNPTIKARIHGETVSILPYVHSCITTGESTIYAKKLERRTKVFTAWNLEGYMFGDIGDYLAIRVDDVNDAYVIKDWVFKKTYAKVTKYCGS